MNATLQATRWVYFVAVKDVTRNGYARFLLTAPDAQHAEKTVLESVSRAFIAHHVEMICSTTDAPFFKEL